MQATGPGQDTGASVLVYTAMGSPLMTSPKVDVPTGSTQEAKSSGYDDVWLGTGLRAVRNSSQLNLGPREQVSMHRPSAMEANRGSMAAQAGG